MPRATPFAAARSRALLPSELRRSRCSGSTGPSSASAGSNTLAEDARGLRVIARIDNPDGARCREVAYQSVNGLSFGYRVRAARHRPAGPHARRCRAVRGQPRHPPAATRRAGSLRHDLRPNPSILSHAAIGAAFCAPPPPKKGELLHGYRRYRYLATATDPLEASFDIVARQDDPRPRSRPCAPTWTR